jgi:hypothetical protein
MQTGTRLNHLSLKHETIRHAVLQGSQKEKWQWLRVRRPYAICYFYSYGRRTKTFLSAYGQCLQSLSGDGLADFLNTAQFSSRLFIKPQIFGGMEEYPSPAGQILGGCIPSGSVPMEQIFQHVEVQFILMELFVQLSN